MPKRAGQVRAYAAAVLDRPNSAPVGGRLAGRLPRLEEELKLHVRHSLAHFKTPQWVTFVDESPKTAAGKFILRAGGARISRLS
jgi:acyl-coenzyme A synthetase/AMP-(fatty) acid ligase